MFEARLNQLSVALDKENNEVRELAIQHLRHDIESLPQNSVIILDAKADLEIVEKDTYWTKVDYEKIEELRRLIAPVMRAKSQSDFKAIRFEKDVVDLGTSHLLGETERYEAIRDAILEQIKELPLTINIVAKESAVSIYQFNTPGEKTIKLIVGQTIDGQTIVSPIYERKISVLP